MKKVNDINKEDNNEKKDIAESKNSNSLKKIISNFFPVHTDKLKEPEVDKDVSTLPAIERASEVIKYNILCFEYSLSPRGNLRHYIKVNISVLLLFGIPILVILPLLAGVAGVADSLAGITGFIFEVTSNIWKTLLTLIGIASTIFITIKAIQYYRNNR